MQSVISRRGISTNLTVDRNAAIGGPEQQEEQREPFDQLFHDHARARWGRTSRSLLLVRFALTFVAYRMKILCIICHDLLIPSEDVLFTRCGHVFHHRCLLQWLERCPKKTCPQCRDKLTEDRIHRVHFTFSNTENAADNADNSLQGRIENLKFQILLNEKNIKYYTSKNATLEKQNAGLRQEVRKVESEITQKNSAIYALKEQIKYFKEKYLEYEDLKKKLSRKEKEVENFRDMHKTLSTGTLEDVQEMVGNTTDRDTLINCISVMKEIILKKTRKINGLQSQLTIHRDSLAEERSKSLEFEERLAFCESENLSLKHQVNELEKPLKIMSDQNCVTKSSNRRNENLISVQTDIYQQINKQETADQNRPSTPEVKIINVNQENFMHNSTFDECPKKKAKLCLRSGNTSDKTNDVVTSDVRNITEMSSQSKQKKMLKLKSLS